MGNELVIHVGRRKGGFVEARLATTSNDIENPFHEGTDQQRLNVSGLIVHVIEIARRFLVLGLVEALRSVALHDFILNI